MSLMNAFDSNHVNMIKDRNMLAYARSVNKVQTKFVALTFYFE